MRLLFPAGMAWLAALVGIATHAYVLIWGGCTGVAVALTVWCVIRRRGGVLALIAVALGSAALISICASAHADIRRPDALVTAAGEDGGTTMLMATIVGLAHATNRGPSQLRMRATATAVEGQPVDVPVTIFGSISGGKAAIGSTVEISGQVILTGPTDAASALIFADDEISVTAGPPWYLGWADDMRRGFVELCADLPGAGGRLLPGLAVGDTSAVDADLDAAMKSSSLSHLTAVSGANCAIVVAFAMLLSSRLGVGRGMRVALALVVLIGFVILVTPQSSVVRASIMAALALLIHLSGRPSGGIPVLAASVILMLALDPWYAFDAGFALSVLATAGLLLLTRPLATALGRLLPRGVAMLIAVPLAAQLACQPVLIVLSGTISLYGVAANILAAPAAPVGTVVGLCACLVAPFAPWVATMLAWVAYVPSSWIAGVAIVATAIPGALIPWIPGPVGALVLAAVTAVTIGLFILPQWRAHWTGKAAITLLCLGLGGAVGITGTPALTRALQRPADWSVAACDVGQGDAVLLRSDGGTMLVDTGLEPELVAHCIETLGITRINVLVLTHYDADHVGGLSGIVERVDVALVQEVHDEAGERVASILASAEVPTEVVTAGVHDVVGGIDYSVLWPASHAATGNAGSIVLDVELDGIRIMLLGDLGEPEQHQLLARLRARTTEDIVKVAHHGSRDQAAELYEQLQATLAIVSVGADNSYGHPASQTLDVLRKAGGHILRTDKRGMILISARDGSFVVWSETTAADSGGG